MISTPARRALPTVQCGAGWVSGTPGDSTSAAKRDQSARGEVVDREARAARLVARGLAVVPARHARAARHERLRGREPGPAEPEDRDRRGRRRR